MDPRIRSGIIETANALGMSPEDLATIISYESGFKPDIWGGAGGRHYGLIQFGPRERQQYGVDVNDPIGSQLGAQGAVARYFQGRGWKPGMSLLDAYSIVNAGSPGRYSASDTAAGGRPGSVYDKVTQQMSEHRKAAQQLLQQTSSTARYDPRRDTPSTGHPVGSTLPGPQPGADETVTVNPFAQPSPAGTPFTLPAKEKKNPWEDLGKGIAEAGKQTAKYSYDVPP